MKWLLRLAVCLAVLALPALASAHTALPARIVDAQAGPYSIEVDLLADIAHAGQAFDLMLLPRAGGVRPSAQLVPGAGVDATPLRGQVTPDRDVPGAFDVHFANVTTGGDWSLVVHADGPSGVGDTSVPLKAVPPPAIPNWAAWLVGLVPLYGLVWFGLREYGRLRASQKAA